MIRIPKALLIEIEQRAREEWPDDKELQQDCIDEEVHSYRSYIEFRENLQKEIREEVAERAESYLDTWSERLHYATSESKAYASLLAFTIDDVSQQTIIKWRMQAARAHETSYEGQLAYLNHKAIKHLSILSTRKKIDPIKQLLIELELIIGSECFNGNIQNYASWGELEGAGRHFRYPVKFYSDSGETKRWSVPSDTPSEELITGFYAFGANELNIYRGLAKVLEHLREHHGLKI